MKTRKEDIWNAIESRDFSEAKKIIDSGVDVNLSDIDTGYSLLFKAIELNNLQIVQLLVAAGADVNLLDDDGCSPLMFACHSGNLEIVQLLVNAGANTNLTYNGETALSIGANAGEKRIVEYLCPLYSSREGKYAMKILPSGTRRRQLRKDKLATTFIEAVFSLDLEAVQSAISNGVNVNILSEDGQPPLHIAIERSDSEMLNLLLHFGADCEIRDEFNSWTPLMKAALENKDFLVKRLLNFGANVNAKTEDSQATILIQIIARLPFYSSSIYKYRPTGQVLKIFNILIEAGINIDSQDEFGNSAITVAMLKRQKDIVEYLRNAGAATVDANRVTWFQAIEMGNVEQLQYCIKTGIDVNVMEYSGKTALVLAAEEGQFEIVRFLVEVGANINTNHSAALFSAVENGHTDIVKFLVQTGADIHAEKPDDLTRPIDYALGIYPEIANFLQKI